MLFSMFIVLYLFLGGCVAGLMLVTALRGILFRRGLRLHHGSVLNGARSGIRNGDLEGLAWAVDFEHYSGRCYVLALVLCLASCSCLVFDLGSPYKAFLLFTHPAFTAITVGAYVLAVALLLLCVLSASHFILSSRGPSSLRPRWVRRIAELLAVPVAVALMGYTGLFLALVDSVPLWNTPWTVVLFVLSAISAGCALSSLAQALSNSGIRLSAAAGKVSAAGSMSARGAAAIASPRRLHVAVILLEVAGLGAFALRTLTRPEAAAARSVALLTSEPRVGWLALGVLCLGLLVPLVAEVACICRGGQHHIPPADLACLLGCFLLRYCLVAAGVH